MGYAGTATFNGVSGILAVEPQNRLSSAPKATMDRVAENKRADKSVMIVISFELLWVASLSHRMPELLENHGAGSSASWSYREFPSKFCPH